MQLTEDQIYSLAPDEASKKAVELRTQTATNPNAAAEADQFALVAAQKAAAAKAGVLLGGEVFAMVRFHGFLVASARCVGGWTILVCSAGFEVLAF